MKIKDIERTANVAWSPKNHHPIYLATGTAAQQLDASFNTNAALEIYSLNLTEPGPDMQLVSSSPSEHRFHKIIWSSYGGDKSNGTIVTGCDGGLIQIYNASKLLKGENALVGKQEKHTGPVHALDFNSFQPNLVATGAGESEIFIWDLNNTNTPMSPGVKSQPLEDVLSVAWNKQVQHILASTFASKCVIWDLRKNEPIIKLTDTVSRIRWKVVAWHPEVATQLCLASEEDHSPIIQIWDLRFATSPLKTLENHQRGVLSLAWCSEDSDLLVSCGKDNRILCWNPNSNQPNGEVLSEISKTNQWSFDVAWCPRNPAIIACPNFDGHVSIYSLMGGKTQQIQTTNKIADSFPGMDGYVQAPVPQAVQAPVSVDLSKPPKWLKRPVGASFGFGGKLITFENDKAAVAQAQQNAQPGQPIPQISRQVNINQVITESELVRKSKELEQAIQYENFIEYCSAKADGINDQHQKYIWHFLRANFEQNPRAEILNLLGYRIEDVNNKLSKFVGKELKKNNVNGLADDFSNLNRIEDYQDDPFGAVVQKELRKQVAPFKIKTGDDTEGLITQALLLNNVEAAVELCLGAKRFADALIIATTGGPDLLARTQHKYLEQSEGYVSSLISAMVSEDWGSIINNCDISSWKEALAAALTHSTDEDLPLLCEQLGSRLENESVNNSKLTQDAQLCYICSGSFDRLVSSWSGNTMKSTEDLQELVELVIFLQKAIERQGRQVQVAGPLADLLSHYASLLASQGELTTALTYLGTSQNEKVASLRERLYVSLGQKPLYPQEAQKQQTRRGSQRQSFTQYASSFTPTNSAPQPTVSGQFGGAGHFFNTGLPNAPTNVHQPWQTQPAPPIASFPEPVKTCSPGPPAPPPTQPPRPTSVGSNQGGSTGLPSRKYVVDPSVSSNQYGIPPPRNQYAPQSTYHTTPSFPVSSAPYTSPVPAPNLNPTPLVPNQTFGSAYMHSPPLRPAPIGSNSAYNSVAPPTSSGVPLPPPVNTYTANSPPGWNDPPALNKPPRPQVKPEVPIPDPIFCPLPGAPTQSFASNGYGDVMAPPTQPYGHAPLAYAPNQPVYQPTPPAAGFSQSFNPSGFNQNAVSNFGSAQQVEKAQEVAAEPVQKAAIPDEHVHMQTVFDDLRNRCSCASNNPQTKRKLEDVGRKLETLYDLLREHKLSPNTLASLHQLVQFIQNHDYPGGLNLYTQLVGGPDFAQIASFMPGLKVLIQIALQLQVYL